jgi:prevent-host-death family protein
LEIAVNHHPRIWPLQEAKAKFSELVRLAQSEGPQTVTVHGEPAVVITAVKAEPKLIAGKYQPTGTGLDLVRAMQACPFPELFDDLERLRLKEPVVLRDVDLE